MTIGKRLIDLARAELNSLLERAGQEDDVDLRPRSGWDGLEALSDEELEAELQRRRVRARQDSERAAKARAASASGRRTASGGAAGGGGRGPGLKPVDEVARAYAALEVRPGANFDTVRKAYRTLMRKYHPDLYTGSPEKQKTANEIAQRLTDAYKLLEKRLRR